MLIIKGIIIGIGKIIPGVSGSMLAISMGEYPRMLDAINNFFKNSKSNFKYLLKISIGIIIAILVFSNVVLSCLNKCYLITIFFFIGLIIGSLEEIYFNANKKSYISLISFSLIIVLGFVSINNEIRIYNEFLKFVFLVLVGIIDAITMVVPGISGTATLMMIGAYNIIIEAFADLHNYSLLIENLKILIPFGIGLVIGTILTVKVISYLFKYYRKKTYSAIVGFSWATIILMGYKCINSNYNLLTLIGGLIMLLLGIFISKKINHIITYD